MRVFYWQGEKHLGSPILLEHEKGTKGTQLGGRGEDGVERVKKEGGGAGLSLQGVGLCK